MENPFKKTAEGSKEDKKIQAEIEENLDEKTKDEVEEEDSENVEEINETESEEEAVPEEVTDSYKEKYEQLNNQYIRLAADFDNYRKRNEQEREALLKYGAESTLKKMLEVIDNFERGLKAIESVDDCEKVKECYNLAYKNFTEALTKAGLESIKAEGEAFDPNFHEAVMQTPTSEKEENTIIAELQKGYKLGDKVLRPTLVNVAVPES
jgi:molecular chaperone GrpE